MTWLTARLAAGSGRAELLRFLLVASGGALAVVLLLSAALVTAIRGGDCRAGGCTQGSLYRTELLDQAGLRPGVVTALVLVVVPVLVFLGMCARIAAAQRDQRLAAVRLAGATPGQVRVLAAADTAAPAALGALIGLVVFVVTKALLERSHLQMTDAVPRALPTDVPMPLVRSTLVVLLVPALCAASAVLALRRVETTPLGVHRRARPRPRATALVPLVVGLALCALAPVLLQVALPLFAVGTVLVLLGLVAAATWAAARTGALAAGRTGDPALLLAARRLQADPHAQGRALSGIVMAVVIACAAAVLRADALVERTDTGFYRNAYDLVDLGLLVALVVAAAGLLVASCEAVVERRRTLAVLNAAGVPLATLRRAVLLQSLLPAVPALLLAAVVGVLAAQLLTLGVTVPWLRLLAVLGLAVGAIALAGLLTLPLLRRTVQPSGLRQT